MIWICVRRAKAALSNGCKPHPATAPAGSNRSSHVGNGVAEAGLQFEITGNAVPAVPADLPVADAFFAGSKLFPFRLKFLARVRLTGHAPIQLLLRADFELAFPRDIEFRHNIRDKRGVQGSQNNDRQVTQHFRSPNCVSKR
jgi:hypothetical protein